MMAPDLPEAQIARPATSPGTEPTLALIVAAYNAASTLPDALDSVLAQACGDWEVIVVDDGSTDGTLPLARDYERRDGRIRVLSQANAGAGAARNAALPHVRARFVGYLDADDRLATRHMCAMLDLMAAYPGRDIYSSDGLFVFPDGSTRRVLEYPGVVSVGIDDMIEECRILGGGAYIRTEALRDLGGFREHMYGEDYDLWLRAVASGLTHIATPEPLYLYHQGVVGQKSENPELGCASTTRALTDLIESGLLTPQQEAAARVSIARSRTDLVLELASRRMRDRVERVVGKRLTGPALAVIHSVSWAIRPFRRWLAGRTR